MPTRRTVLLCGLSLLAVGPAWGGEPGSLRFMLEGPSGRAISDEAFLGKWLLVYFGYTSCPDYCPTSLAKMAAVLELLGEKAGSVAPLFITVDPERDTREVLDGYTPAFDERIVALRGPKAFIDAVAKAYGAEYRIAPGSSDEPQYYTVDHSTWIAFVDPSGQLVTRFPHGMEAATMAKEVEKAMAAWPTSAMN